MGIYMTLNPRVGLTDESRNCISNIRPASLSYEQAAYKLNYLMSEARRRGLSGVNLKDEAEALPQTRSTSADNFLIDRDSSLSAAPCRGQEPSLATGAGSISRSLPTRSLNDALQNRPSSTGLWPFNILKAASLLDTACLSKCCLSSEGSRLR